MMAFENFYRETCMHVHKLSSDSWVAQYGV